jgi:hypothetical protein
LQTNNTQRLLIAASTGAATFSSSAALSAVFNSTDANGGYIFLQKSGSARGYIGSAYHLVAPAGSSNDLAISNDAGNIVFVTGGSFVERMRISSAGKVAIFGGGDDYTLNVQNSRTLGYGLYIQAGNGSLYTAIEAFNYNGSTNIFRLTGAGVLYAQNTTIQAISDVRTKENIVNSTDGLDIINALRPVRFDFKEGFGFERKNQLGFIAQEVEEVFPEIVDEWKFKPEDKITYKTVGPSGLIPILVKAIQELKAEIETLKNN